MDKVTKVIVVITIGLGIVLGIFAGCVNDPINPANVVNGNEDGLISRVVDYGNGVYYFPMTNADFGNALSSFIEKHPELELVAVTENGTGFNGYDLGYFVVFQERTPDTSLPK